MSKPFTRSPCQRVSWIVVAKRLQGGWAVTRHGVIGRLVARLLLHCSHFNFCLRAAAILLLGLLSDFCFRLTTALLFFRSSRGLQPPCLLLGLLPGSGLFHAPALFRRGPRLIQCIDDLSRETLDVLSRSGRMNIEMTQRTPIDVLTPSNGRKNEIIAPERL